ncbi:MAG TPA: hypothetical protein VH062_18245 [Polyangiaceae bacterium]|jgi:hypothetical protein|nr:hypothetical protein [Polyangiaceae bacterium]
MTKNDKSKPAFDDQQLRAGADSALEALKNAGPRAEALIDAWRDAPNAEAVVTASEHGEGPLRKAARRALNVLRARGVPIPEQKRVAALISKSAPEIVEAWMMAPDSTGMQLFAVASHAPSGRYRATFVFLHRGQGVARIENSVMSQSQLKDYFGKLLPGSGYGATLVPPPWARWAIAEARRVHRERNLPEPLGFTTAASLLEPVPASAPEHPFDEEGLELADEDALDVAKDSGKLHNVPEFRSWLPANPAMQELLVKVGSQLSSGETPEPGVVTELLRSEADAATDRFFSPEAREELLGRMKDSALSVLAREGEQRALEIVAAMKAIAKCGLVTDPPREVPFLKAFFDKAIAMMIAEGGGRLRIPVPGKLPESAGAEAVPVAAEAASPA